MSSTPQKPTPPSSQIIREGQIPRSKPPQLPLWKRMINHVFSVGGMEDSIFFIALVLWTIIVLVSGVYIGRGLGQQDGYDRGYAQGHRDGTAD